MANKIINSRVVMKHDTSEHWNLATGFYPFEGEIIIYTDLNKFKIGDGVHNVIDLPFAVAEINDMIGATAETAGTHGLVPAPQAGEQGMFLRGDGDWAEVALPNDMIGATASTSGVHGLVPAPAAGKQNDFLKGDGTWGYPTINNHFTAELTIVASTLNYPIAHNLGTMDIQVQVYSLQSADEYANIVVDVARTDGNNIVIQFGEQLTVGNRYKVLVTSMNSVVNIPSAEEVDY